MQRPWRRAPIPTATLWTASGLLNLNASIDNRSMLDDWNEVVMVPKRCSEAGLLCVVKVLGARPARSFHPVGISHFDV